MVATYYRLVVLCSTLVARAATEATLMYQGKQTTVGVVFVQDQERFLCYRANVDIDNDRSAK